MVPSLYIKLRGLYAFPESIDNLLAECELENTGEEKED